MVFVPVHDPMNPSVVDAEAPSAPFQARLVAEIEAPELVSAAPHAWLMVWPLAKVHASVQPLMGLVPAVTVTSPWNPPGHEPTTL